MTEQNPFESKQRIIQEFVPGKQVTMAHLIANPNEDLYKKLGVVSKTRGALGILTITFALTIKITIGGILGIIIAILIYRLL